MFAGVTAQTKIIYDNCGVAGSRELAKQTRNVIKYEGHGGIVTLTSE